MNWSLVASSLPMLLDGALLTIVLTLASVVAGLLLAVPLALFRTAPSLWLSVPVFGFTYVMRGTPLLVQLFLVYYGLGQIDWIRSSIAWPILRDPVWCALLAFSLNHAAYSTEILRGGINAVPTGEVEAAKALGMGYVLRTRRIVLPLAARLCLPAYGNEIILMIKATSLANTITLMELTGVARKIVAQTFSPYEVFLSAAIVYLAMTFAVTRLFAALERAGTSHNRQGVHAERAANIASDLAPVGKGSGPMRTVAVGQTSAIDPAYVSAAMLRGTWYEIDLGAIRRNYHELRRYLAPRVRIYACLKRNAYGCGVGPVARALALEGVTGFAVASVLDAVEIRSAGVREPILLYPGATPLSVAILEDLNLTVTISSRDELAQWEAVARRLPVFIKIDLGFFRAGATPLSAFDLVAAVRSSSTLQLQGVYAHVSELPGQTRSHALAQLSRMNAVLMELERSGIPAPMTMMSSTESVLTYPEMDFDAVDPGALFIGLPEAPSPVRSVTLEPALKKISTSLVSAKSIDGSLGPLPELPGFRAGMRMGVVGMGWGDGVPRTFRTSSFAIVRGRRAQLLPPVHLEHLRIDLTDIPDACFGDEVVLLGCQKQERIPLEEVAESWGTDAVGLYGRLRDHVPRIYT